MSDRNSNVGSNHTNVISLDRARQLRQDAINSVRFPHMYDELQTGCKCMLDELSWLDDDGHIPEGLMQAFVDLDCAIRDSMIQLAAYIDGEMRAGDGDDGD